MKHPQKLFMVFVATWLATQTITARASTIITNLNGNDGTGTSIMGGGRNKGMGFTMPGGDAYQLDSVILRLSVQLGIAPVLQIWTNNASNVPESSLITLNNPIFAFTGISNYAFIPSSGFTLQAATSYWLVLSGIGDVPVDWKASSPALTPTGIATHLGALFDTDGTPPTVTSTNLNSYAVNGTVVPEPASAVLLGFGAAFCLRRRSLRTHERSA